MSYIGKTPTPAPLTANDLSDGIITSAKISDGTVAQVDLIDQAVNEAKMQVSNSPTNGYFLSAQSGNTGGMTWAEAGGGGKVLQVLQTVITNRQSGSGGFNDVSGLSVAITPSASDSKILVMTSLSAGSPDQYAFARIMRDSTAISIADASNSNQRGSFGNYYNSDNNNWKTMGQTFLDSPNTTSQTTYKVQFVSDGNTYFINYGGSTNTTSTRGNGTSSITVIEIGA